MQRCSVKKVFLRILQNSRESTCARVSFSIKLQAWGLQLYRKRDSGTVFFMCNLTKFLRILFYITPLVAASVRKTFEKDLFKGSRSLVICTATALIILDDSQKTVSRVSLVHLEVSFLVQHCCKDASIS